MSIFTHAGRATLAEIVLSRPIHLALGLGEDSWGTPPPAPDYDVTTLRREIGRKKQFKYVPGKFFRIPRIRSNSEEIKKRLEYANKYLKTNVKIYGAGTEYTLKPAELDKMIDASDGDIKVKEKAVKKFIGAISEKFTTVGMRRKLRLVGGKVDVSGGNYGYVLNEKKQR